MLKGAMDALVIGDPWSVATDCGPVIDEAARKGNPEVKEFCNACFTGEYPTGDITREILDSIEGERVANQKLFSFS